MNMFKKYSLALLIGSALGSSFSVTTTMNVDIDFGGEAGYAHQVAPSQEAIDAYRQDVGRRMKKLFDALMVAPTTPRLGDDAATKLAKLFNADGGEGSLLNFYRQEFVKSQQLFTEDIEQDWPDQSYCDVLFSTLINSVKHFLSWAKQDVLPVFGDSKYRITIDGDDVISNFFAAAFEIEPRAQIQKGGAAEGVTRAMHWLEQINNLWALPDMPEFGFDFGDGSSAGNGFHGSSSEGHGFGGASNGKSVFINNCQMGVIGQEGSTNYVSLQPGSTNTIYIPAGVNVTFEQTADNTAVRVKDVPELVLEELENVSACSSPYKKLADGGRAVIKNTRGLIGGTAFWIGLDFLARGTLNLADTPEVAIVALVVGGVTQVALSFSGSAR